MKSFRLIVSGLPLSVTIVGTIMQLLNECQLFGNNTSESFMNESFFINTMIIKNDRYSIIYRRAIRYGKLFNGQFATIAPLLRNRKNIGEANHELFFRSVNRSDIRFLPVFHGSRLLWKLIESHLDSMYGLKMFLSFLDESWTTAVYEHSMYSLHYNKIFVWVGANLFILIRQEFEARKAVVDKMIRNK